MCCNDTRNRLALGPRCRRPRCAHSEAILAPPFGGTAFAGALVPESVEQDTLHRSDLRAAGASQAPVTATLTSEGRPPTRGDRWLVVSLRRILARSADGPRPRRATRVVA